MVLHFLFSNLNAIVLTFQGIFLVIVTLRFYRPAWITDLSFLRLILIAIGFNILYVLFVTWGQYYTWSVSSDVSKILLDLPLSKDAPLPAYAQWLRPVFENPLGYFAYYVLGRVWLDMFLLFLTAGVFYFFLEGWYRYRGGFEREDSQLILLLMLTLGWPGNIIFVYLGFGLTLVSSLYFFVRGRRAIKIEPVFIVAAFLTLFFTPVIMHVIQ